MSVDHWQGLGLINGLPYLPKTITLRPSVRIEERDNSTLLKYQWGVQRQPNNGQIFLQGLSGVVAAEQVHVVLSWMCGASRLLGGLVPDIVVGDVWAHVQSGGEGLLPRTCPSPTPPTTTSTTTCQTTSVQVVTNTIFLDGVCGATDTMFETLRHNQ